MAVMAVMMMAAVMMMVAVVVVVAVMVMAVMMVAAGGGCAGQHQRADQSRCINHMSNHAVLSLL